MTKQFRVVVVDQYDDLLAWDVFERGESLGKIRQVTGNLIQSGDEILAFSIFEPVNGANLGSYETFEKAFITLLKFKDDFEFVEVDNGSNPA